MFQMISSPNSIPSMLFGSNFKALYIFQKDPKFLVEKNYCSFSNGPPYFPQFS